MTFNRTWCYSRKEILVGFILLLSWVVGTGEVAAQEGRGLLPVRHLLPPESARSQGHPKLVALLVAEDYEPAPGRADWGSLGQLPGVWQDLARVYRRLEALGFGEIVVLGAGERNGSQRTVNVRLLSGLSAWEPEGRMAIPIQGPATRAAIIQVANQLNEHLNNHRIADDGQGGEVPPVFVFYYSGHGFVDSKGVH